MENARKKLDHNDQERRPGSQASARLSLDNETQEVYQDLTHLQVEIQAKCSRRTERI